MEINYENFIYTQSKNVQIDEVEKQKPSNGMLSRKKPSTDTSKYSDIPAYRVELYRREIEKQNLKKQGMKDAETTT